MQVDSGSSPGKRPAGNTALKALRLSRHWTQAEFAAEFEQASRALGKVLSLSVRQVRRWESEDPPCPLPAYQRVLEEVFGVSVAQMGFQVGWSVPWAPRPEPSQPPIAATGRAPEPGAEDDGGAGGATQHGRMAGLCRTRPADRSGGHDPVKRREFVTSAAAALTVAGAGENAYGAEAPERLPAAADPAGRAVPFDRQMVDGYEFITSQQRSLYYTVPPARMYSPAVAHAQLGAALLSGTGPQAQRSRLAGSLAEASLLAARLAFFDLKKAEPARMHYRNALVAAREADDHQLGSAILAHLAFIPAWDGKAGESRDLMRAAYAHAARGVSAVQRSWLHAVDAEIEARLGDNKRAVDLIGRAEEALSDADRSSVPDPEWLDYFDATRLNGFKGFCHINGGSPELAQEALLCSLMALKPNEAKQRTIVLADMADIHVRTKEIEQACATLERALVNLDKHWYGIGWDRIYNVRRKMDHYDDTRSVRELDMRMNSSWGATMRLAT
jgi:hypothetical protein